MRKRMLLTLAMLSAAGLMAVAPVFAQDQERVKANIPFAFNVGSKVLPAGNYEVRAVFAQSLMIPKRGHRRGSDCSNHVRAA